MVFCSGVPFGVHLFRDVNHNICLYTKIITQYIVKRKPFERQFLKK